MRNTGLEPFTKRTHKPAGVKGDMEKIFVVHWEPWAGNREETTHNHMSVAWLSQDFE